MKRLIFKSPGQPAESLEASTSDDSLLKLLGGAFESTPLTRDFWTDDNVVEIDDRILLLFGHRETALAAKREAHLQLGFDTNGTIYGPVIVVRARNDGKGFVSLTEADEEFAIAFLGEYNVSKRPVNLGEKPTNRELSQAEAKSLRRDLHKSILQTSPDDFNAVLRSCAEIEVSLRELVASKAANPEFLEYRHASLELSQMTSIAAALGLIKPEMPAFVHRLSAIRNKYAHEPGYAPSYAELSAAERSLSPLFSDLAYVEGNLRDDWAEATNGPLSRESLRLRSLFFIANLLIRWAGEELNAS